MHNGIAAPARAIHEAKGRRWERGSVVIERLPVLGQHFAEAGERLGEPVLGSPEADPEV